MSNFNNAINPKQDGSDSLAAVLMPSRSAKVKTVKVKEGKDGIGGMTNLKTGEVWIPTGDNAKERTIRFHEAMHASHSLRKVKFRDLLDQALEDARLHRYMSKSAGSEFQRARRDEVSVALRDLRYIRREWMVNAAISLTVMRAMAILLAGRLKPSHVRLLHSVLSRFGEQAGIDFREAIGALKNSSGDTAGEAWRQARRRVQKYFTSDFKSDSPSSSALPESPEFSPEEPEKPDTIPGEPPPPKGESPKDDKKDGSPTKDADSDMSDSEESEEAEPTFAPEPSSPEPELEIAPPVRPPKKKRTKAAREDEYTADLTPAIDKYVWEKMQGKYPLRLYIRRLDMGINRVKLSLGRKSPMPVISGQKILAGKLASAFTPGARIFARTISHGGQGTILIDASGSMAIPTETLCEFLATAPALTLAFYNAPDDNYIKHPYGNIFIYAANGYRASVSAIDSRRIPHYGSGNLIDYHAICWLLKQPRPHYIVTDQRWTGPWQNTCQRLCRKLTEAKDLIIVRNLKDMEGILQNNKRHG